MDAKRLAYTQWNLAKDNVTALLDEWENTEHSYRNMETITHLEAKIQLNIISALNALTRYNYLKQKRNKFQ